jgi:hypothetical protein
MGEKRNAYRLLVGKPEGKRTIGRQSNKWVDNIKINLAVTGWGFVNWISLAHDRDKWTVLEIWDEVYLQSVVNSAYYVFLSNVVLYGCETWSLTVRQEHKLRVFENRVLRRIFGPKRDGVMGWWRKLYNEEIHNLYSSPSIIRIIKSRRMRWVGHVA